ncbi:MAG: DUF1553 domain-containing protein [Rubripirellula sp.]
MLLVVLRPPRVNVDIFHKNFPAMFIVLTSLLVNVGVSFTSTYANETIDFNSQIRPILSSACFACHGPDENERAAGLRLDTIEGATQDLGGYAAITPGDADASEMLARILSEDEDLRMPPPEKGTRLTEQQVALLRTWLEQGAEYSVHWSYAPPRKSELPDVSREGWSKNEVDHFILAELESRDLQPSESADRLTLARRLSLDLVGLPPTWQEAIQFRDDSREDAYERYVDSLLERPTFGERWAHVWLDLARYADSAGYADDPPRTIWAFRDYVIQSLNENKSFDQFTIEQIAGDLLPEPTSSQLIATAFHRNTLTNNEGGTNDEEFRNVAVVDRVNTTMAVWMGTTAACAQCHTHKYDPITQKEYFELFAFFNTSQDADRRDEQPLHEVWSAEQLALKEQLTGQLEDLNQSLNTVTPEISDAQDVWLSQLKDEPQWKILIPEKVDSEHRNANVAGDGWIEFSDQGAEKDVVTATFPIDHGFVSGFRLEVPEKQLRNFVLSGVQARWEPDATEAMEAQILRVELPGKQKMIHLAELQIFSNGKNVAVDGRPTQSSTDFGGDVAYINDGNTDGNFQNKSVTHTAISENPWVEIDLGATHKIDQIVIWNRTDGGDSIQGRLAGYRVSLLDSDRQIVWSQSPKGVPKPSESISIDGGLDLTFATAIANHEQTGFSASNLVIDPALPRTGWAVGPHVGKSHEAVMILEQAKTLESGRIILRIDHQSEHLRHLIDYLRVSATGNSTLQDWAKLPLELQPIMFSNSSEVDTNRRKELAKHFLKITPILADQREQASSLEKQLAGLKPTTTVPIMREQDKTKSRTTHIQVRGNYQNVEGVVNPGTPSVFHSITGTENPNRMDLAKWLVDENNPLTARVIVNRHWEQIFGTGIVSTSEEFGSQGDLPSHPELLDWLAVELMQSGWDLKHLIKKIVMSATYRQNSRVTDTMRKQDPDNRFYTRGPRFRASAEVVRDQALFISELLSQKMYGPPVKPPQPKLGLTAAFGSGTDWNTSSGDDRYRRGIYTTWRRSSPYPSMAQFDAPNREVCTVRRIPTNTPLQALVTLNDPVYVEAAQAFAREIIQAEDATNQRIEHAFKKALIRLPTNGEIERLSQLVEEVQGLYQDDQESAMQIATDPLGKLPDSIDVVDAATWTVIANVILNLDEILMKR